MVLPALLAGSLLLAAGATASAPDAAFDAPLQALYDGSTDTAREQLATVAAAYPSDPLPLYFQALALAWKLEQAPERRDRDEDLLALAARAIALADARLRADPRDARACFARGAAHGASGRLHMFRREAGASAREAVAMRTDLRRALELDPENEDARFGLALYDYYADVLPRLLKLLRFFAGIPGGDRERGLLGLRRAAERARWHRSEARSQLYEVAAYYERDADQALLAICDLRGRYPGSPLWALRLAEHLRDRLGLFDESARAYAEVSAAHAAGHPNYAPVVASLAALGQADARLRDLRLDDARRALEAVDVASVPQLLAPRFELLRRLDTAARDPLTAPRARARRLSEAGDRVAAGAAWRQVLALRPRDLEAAFHAGRDELEAGRLRAAGAALERVRRAESPEPAWLGPAARLLLARLREQEGRRTDAVALYKEVLMKPGGSEHRRREAAEALRRLSLPARPAASPPPWSEHPR